MKRNITVSPVYIKEFYLVKKRLLKKYVSYVACYIVCLKFMIEIQLQ